MQGSSGAGHHRALSEPLFLSASAREKRARAEQEGKPLISAIVPIYNLGERYLRPCLESLIHQTLDNIEIILVNDDSPKLEDEKICLEYAARDSRIKYIKHETNKGTNIVRYTGFSAASGQFIHFIDGDDYIALNAYEVLAQQMLQYEVDILSFSFMNLSDDPRSHKPQLRCVSQSDDYFIFGEDIFTYFSHHIVSGSVWDKIYRSSFLRGLGDEVFSIDSSYPSTQDVLFNMKVCYEAHSLMHLNIPFYYYRESRLDSATNIVSERRMNSIKNIAIHLFHYFKAKGAQDKLEQVIGRMAAPFARTLFIIQRYKKKADRKQDEQALADALAEVIELYSHEIAEGRIHAIMLERFGASGSFARWYQQEVKIKR